MRMGVTAVIVRARKDPLFSFVSAAVRLNWSLKLN